MLEYINTNYLFKIIGIIILILIIYIVIKTIIEEVVKLGIKGLFIGFPKAIFKVIMIIPNMILFILKLIYDFLRRFIKALKICIFGVK